jgi:S-adenosylmethionine-diacylgycerolhomoserine-N-methlytransferase
LTEGQDKDPSPRLGAIAATSGAQEAPTAGHGALMDAVYRRQRHFYDLTRKYYLFGRDRAIRDLDLPEHARLVEVGCGTARNLVKVAARYPSASLFGLDASSEMLKSAEASLARAGLAGKTKLALGYAEELSPALFGESEPFDAVFFSYSLSMIPDWKQALRSASRALSENGKIHLVDFGDLTGLGRIGEHALASWLKLFHVTPRRELLHVFEDETRNEAIGKLRILPGRYAFLATVPKSRFEAL